MQLAEFEGQIRSALEHLHDFVHLLNLPLTKALASTGISRENAARELRSAIVDAISTLDNDLTESEAREHRGYAILFGRYMQGMTTGELLEDLNLSLRQLRREEKRAFEAVVALLWDQFRSRLPHTAEGEPEPASPTQSETLALLSKSERSEVDLRQMLDGVLETLAPLFQQRHVVTIRHEKGTAVSIPANRVALRQALLCALMQGVSGLNGGKLRVCTDYQESQEHAVLAIYAGPYVAQSEEIPNRMALCQDLLQKQGGYVQAQVAGSSWSARLCIPKSKRTIEVLVIDDNEGLIELFKRYSSGTAYRVIAASSGQEALSKAQQQRPHIITLDVMMPQQDGWEVLRLLRNQPGLEDIPIIVCSVLNEPELATMLGASDFLAKPVTQSVLLATLVKWAA